MKLKQCPECLKYFEQAGDWQRICKCCYARAKRNRDSDTEDFSSGYVIPKPLMKKVRQLVHPDRHGGSQLANAVMAELNKIMAR